MQSYVLAKEYYFDQSLLEISQLLDMEMIVYCSVC